MLRRLLAVALSVALFVPAYSSEAPLLLIVQRLSNGPDDYNVLVGQYLAEELDLEGRVEPVLWSMTDSTFRSYIDEGKLPRFVENPDDNTIRDYARRMRASYVLVVEAVARDQLMYPQARLYRGSSSRPMWSMIKDSRRGRPRLVVVENGEVNEEQTAVLRQRYAGLISADEISTMTVMVGGLPDWVSTAKSLARTWTLILGDGPLKGLVPLHRQFTPVPDRGLGFDRQQDTIPGAAQETQAALERARLLAADGYVDIAIMVLRDAIDSDPFAVEPRLEATRLLLRRGLAPLAAGEAERAAGVAVDSTEVWSLAALAWVRAGDADRALSAANESLARGGQSAELMQTLGEIWLLKGRPTKALESYDRAITLEPSPQSYLGRSVARAIAGDLAGCIEDLELAQGELELPPQLYQAAIVVIDSELDNIADSLRDIHQRARLGEDPGVVAQAEQAQRTAAALVEFLVRARVPAQHRQSHEGRDLAHKLLSQSAHEALAFAKTRNEDSAMESAISLGEALRLMPRIREQFRLECKYS
ncbi:MAG: hypothetical protein IH945_05570 [Armatimonadetes bacterium]|nr:hypothetical protein [Armatimonadota bacterium]